MTYFLILFCLIGITLFILTIKQLGFSLKDTLLTVPFCALSIALLFVEVFFYQTHILLFCCYLTLSCLTFYLIFSRKKLVVFLLTLKAYYLCCISCLLIFSLYEIIAEENFYILMDSPSFFALAFLIVSLLYMLLEILLSKGLDKEKMTYLLTTIHPLIPSSMLILLMGKNCSLLYVLFFSRHALLVSWVILASTLLEVYFGIFAVIAVHKAYTLSIYKHTNKILHMQYDLQMTHLNQLEAYQTEMRRIAHDIGNHKTVLYNLIESKDYEAALSYLTHYGEGFGIKKWELLTPHKTLNTLLLSKKEICLQHGIAIELNINVPSKLALSDFDLCIIVGNLMDNALEATQKIAHTGQAYIHVKSSILNENFIFDIKNNFDQSIAIHNQKIATTKKDKINHGLGLSNICATVDKYQGTCQFSFEKDTFAAFVMIPLVDD